MSSASLVTAVSALAVALTIGYATIAGASVQATRLAAATDDAALAGSDTALGWRDGSVCARAAEALRRANFELSDCTVDGVIVTVEAQGHYGLFPVKAWSRAGPPP